MNISQAPLTSLRTQAIANRGSPVTYKRFVSETRNLLTGTVSQTESETVILALTGGLKQLPQGRGRIFRVMASTLPTPVPSRKDTITYQGHTYSVDTWQTSQLGDVVDIVGISL